MNQVISANYKTISIKTKDHELFKKYKLLHGLGKVVTENLLREFLKRVDLLELRDLYIKKGEKGIQDLIEKIFGREM
jgi:hypothetical protein